MSIFLRNLPDTIQLNPSSDVIPSYDTLVFQWTLHKFFKQGIDDLFIGPINYY